MHEGVAHGFRVVSVADNDGGTSSDARRDQVLQFGLRADKCNDLVAMGLEGGEQAGADIAGRAEEEDFHVGREEEDVMIMIAKPDQLGTRDGRLYDVIFVYDPMPEVDAPRLQGL